MRTLDLFHLLNRFIQQREKNKQLELQLKTATLKSKSQRWNENLMIDFCIIHFLYSSQQIQDQRQRRLIATRRAARSVRQ